MTQQPTCGQGLAGNAALPAGMAEVTGLLADILELHLPSLDLTDPLSRREHEVYQGLFIAYREVADRMRETAQRMAGYGDLPMGRHDLKALADKRMVETFEEFARRKQDLLTLLQESAAADAQILTAMRSATQSE